jgi:hypothetical protein
MPTYSGTFGGATPTARATPRSPRRPRRPRNPPNTYSGTSTGQGGGSVTVDPRHNPPTVRNTPRPSGPHDPRDPRPGLPPDPEPEYPDTGIPPEEGTAPSPGAGGTTPPPTGPVDEAGYPLTPASAAARSGADESYGIAEGDAHQSLYRAALQYGDPDVLQLYSAYGPVVDNPNSDLATIQRNEGLQHINLGNQMNANNLYFSGTNQKGQESLSTEASRQRTNAYQRWKDAEQRLLTAIATAGAKRNDVYRTTGADDIATALAQPPQATGTAPGDEPPPEATPGTTPPDETQTPKGLGPVVGDIHAPVTQRGRGPGGETFAGGQGWGSVTVPARNSGKKRSVKKGRGKGKKGRSVRRGRL